MDVESGMCRIGGRHVGGGFFPGNGRHRGSSLIEVLVAILITATGVLGAAAAQLSAVKFNQTAGARSAAVLLANDISDRMRGNRTAALAGDYDIPLAGNAPAGTAVSQIDLREWLEALAVQLPAGDGQIERSGATFVIRIQWQEARLGKSRETAASSLEQFQFITRL